MQWGYTVSWLISSPFTPDGTGISLALSVPLGTAFHLLLGGEYRLGTDSYSLRYSSLQTATLASQLHGQLYLSTITEDQLSVALTGW